VSRLSIVILPTKAFLPPVNATTHFTNFIEAKTSIGKDLNSEYTFTINQQNAYVYLSSNVHKMS